MTIVVPGKREEVGESQSLVDLNPLGSAVVAATWVTLITLNLWCWTKVLSRKENKAKGA
mgnify:CR=1 FL=1